MKKGTIRAEYGIILLVLVIKSILHLIADSHSGLDGDEIYHVNTGQHLAWGYMEFPPMIGFMAWLQNLFHTQSIYIHHLFVHLAAGIIIVLCGLAVIRMGGKWKAVLLCLSCILTGSCFGLTQNAFQPVIFDQLFWVLSFYLLISYLQTTDNQYLIFLGISIALGFMTKYSILFFASGIIISILIFQRELFRTKACWLSLLLALIIISPNLYWQWKFSFPVLSHFSRLYEVQLDELKMSDNLKALVLSPNPMTIFVWLTGIFVIPFLVRYKQFRVGLFAVLFSFVLLLLAKGKFYYFYPMVLIGFIIGSVFLEYFLERKKWWLVGYISLLLFMTPLTATNALPVLPLEKYIKVYNIPRNEAGVTPVMDSYSCGIIWGNLNDAVKRVYLSLPEQEREGCLIWGDTYSWASAINFYAEKYQLPNAISFHGTHYLWVPNFSKGITVIAICNSSSKEDFEMSLNNYKQYFSQVELKEQLFNQFSEDKTDYYLNIFLCRDLKYDSETMKKKMKHRIFE